MKINSSENISDKNQRKNSGRSLLSKIRRIGVYIILSVVLVIGGIYMYSAFSKRNIYINSFEVSDNLAKQGITGMSAANQLLDKIAIIRETKLDRYKKEYLNLLIIDTNSNQIFIDGPGSGPEVAGTNAATIIVEDAEEDAEAHRKLLAVFPITPGRRQFIHHGTWKIANSVEFPTWSYDKQFLETGVRSKDKSRILKIPGGPNNPIGVIWNGLTKSGIGIHGTSSPRTIGRSVSAGCIRLSNWDAGRFPNLVRPGAKAVIR